MDARESWYEACLRRFNEAIALDVVIAFRVCAKAVLLACCLAGSAHAAEARIDVANRVGNRTDYGVCWWAAAEMIGKQYGIKELTGLTEKVVADGHGFKGGAGDSDIKYWMDKLGVKWHSNPHAKCEAGAQWIKERLAAGIPVVSCNNYIGGHRNGKVTLHAWVMLKIDSQGVHYVDCNDITEVKIKPYQEWYDWWYGRAISFEMPKPEQHTAKPETPKQPVVLLPQVLVPDYPPGYVRKFASNQDIKDGVRRPDDTLRYGLFGDAGISSGYDYYHQHRPAGVPRP